MPTSPESERPSSSIVGRERVCAFWGGFLFFIAILKIIPVPIENISLRVILKTGFTRAVVQMVVFVSFFVVPVIPLAIRIEVVRFIVFSLFWLIPWRAASGEKELALSTCRTIVDIMKIMGGPRLTW